MEKQKKEIKKNIPAAFLLSLLVMLVGGGVWGLCYAAGFFSAWIEMIAAFFAVYVFNIFYKKLPWWAVLYVTILSIAINFFAMCISATIIVLNEMPEQLFGDIFALVLEVSFGEGVTDTIYCVVFTVLGSLLAFLSIFMQNKRKGMIVNNQSSSSKPIDVKQKDIKQVNAKELYNDIIGDITMLLNDLKVSKDKNLFMKKFVSYVEKNIDPLEEDIKDKLKLECLNPIDDQIKDKARKLILKVLIK